MIVYFFGESVFGFAIAGDGGICRSETGAFSDRMNKTADVDEMLRARAEGSRHEYG